MAELNEGRLFELYGRTQVEVTLLREEIARLRGEIADLQAVAASSAKEADHR